MADRVAPMVRKTKLELTVDLVVPGLGPGEEPRLVASPMGPFRPQRMHIVCWPGRSAGSAPRARVTFMAPGRLLGRAGSIPDRAVFRIFGYPHDEPAPEWVRELVDEVSIAAGMVAGVWPWDVSPSVPRPSNHATGFAADLPVRGGGS